jgi:predicted component of type VI protein secretion system
MGIRVLDSNGTAIRNDSRAAFPYTLSLDLEEGTYYIEMSSVSYASNNTGAFTLQADFVAVNNVDIRPNNTRTGATSLQLEESVIGFISATETTSVYKYELEQSGRLTLKSDNRVDAPIGSRSMSMRWLDSSGNVLANDSRVTFPYEHSLDLEAGTYYIETAQVSYVSDNTGAFSLQSDFVAVDNVDIRPNNTRTGATSLQLGQNVTGFISVTETTSVYKYVLPQSGRLTLKSDNRVDAPIGSRSMSLRWLDSNGTVVRNESRVTFPYEHSLDLEAGTYYIEVSRVSYADNNTGAFSLQADFVCSCGLCADCKPAFKLGDVDMDGDITIADALEILKHLAGISTLTGTPLAAALIIDPTAAEPSIADALEILKHLAGITSKLD